MNFYIENPKAEFDNRGEYFRSLIEKKNKIMENGTDKEKQKMEKLNEKYNRSVYCNNCGYISKEGMCGLFRVLPGSLLCQECYDLLIMIRSEL